MTRQEFIDSLPGTDFMASFWNIEDQAVFDILPKFDNAKSIYHVARVEQRSNFIECYKGNGESSRRDFRGNNKFWAVGRYLVHKNYRGDYNCWMINRR